MKILNKKNILLIILSFVFALSTLVFASTATVRADDAVETPTGVFEMVSGASIRVGVENEQDDSGIRFMVKMSADKVDEIKTNDTNGNVKLGFIITVKELFDARTADESETPAYGKDDYIKSISRYVGYDNGGIIVDEGKIYEKDGFYWANAAVVKVNDLDIEYVAIAYYVENETYTYASFDQTISRSVLGTASKVYLNSEQGLEEELEYLRKSEDLTAFGTASQPVQINDDNDIYALSTAVNDSLETCTYEEKIDEETTQTKPVQFKLNKDVTVDHDFTQIGAGFGGEFVASENKVTIINNAALEGKIFENTDIVVNTQKLSDKLFDMTARAGSALYYTSSGKRYEGETIAFEDAEEAINFVGFGKEEDGDVIKLHVSSNNGYVKLNINYTAEQLAAYKEAYTLQDVEKELAVKFTYMTIGADAMNNFGSNMFAAVGYGQVESGLTDIPDGRWITSVISIEDLITTYASTGELSVFRTYINNGDSFDFYFGGIEFVEWNFETDFFMNYDYKFVVSEEITSRFTSNIDGQTYVYKTAENLPTTYRYGSETKDIINDIDFKDNIIHVTGKTAGATTIKMNYTGNQYLSMSQTEEYGFNAVKVTYFMAAHGSNSVNRYAGELIHSAGNTTGSWTTAFVSVNDFVAAFGQDCGTYGGCEEHTNEGGNARGFHSIPSEKTLVLHANGYAHNGYTLLIGAIDFVNIAEEMIGISMSKKIDFEVSDENTANITDNTSKEYVVTVESELPTTCTYDVDGVSTTFDITNNVEFTGSAFKIAAVEHNVTYSLNFNYTANQISSMCKAGYFNAVRFYFMVAPKQDYTFSLKDNLGDASIMGSYYGAQRLAIPTLSWTEHIIPINQFVDAFSSGDGTKAALLKTSYTTGSTVQMDMYFSSFEFVTVDNGSTEFGEYGLTATQDNAERVFGAKVYSAKCYNYMGEYVSNGSLPTDVQNGINYQGDAIRVTTASACETFIKMNYSVEEYKVLAEKNGWTSVKFRYMVYKTTSGMVWDTDTFSVLGIDVANITTKTWIEVTLTMDQFYACFTNESRWLNFVSRPSKNVYELYVGNIDFISSAVA